MSSRPSRRLAAAALAVATLTPLALRGQEGPIVKPISSPTPPSPTITVATVPGPVPAIHSTWTARGTVVAKITWRNPGNARSFQVLYADAVGGDYRAIHTIHVAQQPVPLGPLVTADVRVALGVPSFYRIRATYDGNAVGVSEAVRLLVQPHPVGVAGLTATSPGPGTAMLRWTADPEAIGYRITRRKGTEATVTLHGTPPFVGTSLTDAGLWNGATYTYVVSSVYRESWLSGSSGTVALTIQP